MVLLVQSNYVLLIKRKLPSKNKIQESYSNPYILDLQDLSEQTGYTKDELKSILYKIYYNRSVWYSLILD